MSMPLAISYFCRLMMAGKTEPSEGGANTTIVTLGVSAALELAVPGNAALTAAAKVTTLKILERAAMNLIRTYRSSRPVARSFRFLSTRPAFPSSPPLCDKPCRGLEQCSITAKRREGGFGLLDQPKQLFLCLRNAQDPDCGCLAGIRVFAGRLPNGCDVALDIENIIGDLEGFSDSGAKPIERRPLAPISAAEDRPGDAGITQQRAGLHRLQLLDIRQIELRLGRRKPTFRREIEHLASRHAAEPCGARKPEHQGASDRRVRMGLGPGQNIERKSQKTVDHQNGGRLVECPVQRRSAATQIVIVHCRHVVMDQRIAMYAFQRGRRHQAPLLWHCEQRRAFNHEKRAEAFAAAEARVTHGL